MENSIFAIFDKIWPERPCIIKAWFEPDFCVTLKIKTPMIGISLNFLQNIRTWIFSRKIMIKMVSC